MPPTSRGIILLRFPYRIPRPIRSPARSRNATSKLPKNIPTAQTRPHLPEPEGPTLKEKTAELPPSQQRAPPGVGRRLYDRFARPTFRFLLLLVPWIPPLLVLKMHFPIQIVAIEGPSMQPILNPNYTSEAGPLNTKDHVMVLRHHATSSAKSKKPDEIQRGQVVVLRAPHDPEKVVVKRVVAVPGDRVTPSSRYPGGDTPITIPWNHLWVEGDIADREKSVDSNWYGPISKALIIGTVRATIPYWPLPYLQRVDWESHSYPGESRVKRDAIRAVNPDVEERAARYLPGRLAEQMLRQLDENQGEMVKRAQIPAQRESWQTLLRGAREEAARNDPETRETAVALARELHALLTARVVTETQKNVSVTKKEFEALKSRGEIPDSILAGVSGKSA